MLTYLRMQLLSKHNKNYIKMLTYLRMQLLSKHNKNCTENVDIFTNAIVVKT